MQLPQADRAPKTSNKQKIKLALANLGIGPYYTRIGIDAEIADKQFGIVDEPSTKSMVELLNKVTKARTSEEKYGLLVQPVPYPNHEPGSQRPELWFDYIDELTSVDIIEGIGKTAIELLPIGKSSWHQALDLGAGTGYLGATLIGEKGLPRVADSVTLVDSSSTMLNVAADRYGSKMDCVQADVTKLPFADQSFDLVTSAGLVYGLGAELQKPYFKEVSRILQPNGIYLDGDYIGGNKHSKSKTIPRIKLEWLIKAHAALEMPFDPLIEIEDKVSYFQQFGLDLSYSNYKDAGTGNDIQIRILQKQP